MVKFEIPTVEELWDDPGGRKYPTSCYELDIKERKRIRALEAGATASGHFDEWPEESAYDTSFVDRWLRRSGQATTEVVDVLEYVSANVRKCKLT